MMHYVTSKAAVVGFIRVTACREAECILGIDGSLMGTLQRQLLTSEVSCGAFGEQELEQKHQDLRP